jgi:hypothetical protein
MNKQSEYNPEYQYTLTIRMDSDGFSLFVSSNQSGSPLTSKRIDCEFSKQTFESILNIIDSETRINHNHIKIIIESNQYVLIPTDFFKLEDVADLLFLEHKISKSDSILFNKIPEFGIVNVFAMPGIILEALTQLFPETEIDHHISELLTDNVKLSTENCAYCRARNKMLDIVAVKNSRINLINSFDYETNEDFLYFVLNVYEKLNLEASKTPLFVYNIEQKTDLKSLLEKYIVIGD